MLVEVLGGLVGTVVLALVVGAVVVGVRGRRRVQGRLGDEGPSHPGSHRGAAPGGYSRPVQQEQRVDPRLGGFTSGSS